MKQRFPVRRSLRELARLGLFSIIIWSLGHWAEAQGFQSKIGNSAGTFTLTPQGTFNDYPQLGTFQVGNGAAQNLYYVGGGRFRMCGGGSCQPVGRSDLEPLMNDIESDLTRVDALNQLHKRFQDFDKKNGTEPRGEEPKPEPNDPKHNTKLDKDYCCADGHPGKQGEICQSKVGQSDPTNPEVGICGKPVDQECPKKKDEPSKPDPGKPGGGGNEPGGGGTGPGGGGGGGGCGPGGCGPGGGGGGGGGLLGGMNPAQMLQGLAGLAAMNQANQGNQQAAALSQLEQSSAYATAMAQLTAAAATTPEKSAEELLAQFQAQETAAVATATAAALAGSPVATSVPVDQVNAYLPAPTASAAPSGEDVASNSDAASSVLASEPTKSEYEID